MKREYKQPIAKFIDYAYEEQVVAESINYSGGSGDGNNTGFCTYQSGSLASPCTGVVNSSFDISVCNWQPWSLE